VTGSGGDDRAYLYGTAGEDTFYGDQASSRLVLSTGGENKAIGFGTVKADAGGGSGSEQAYLTGSTGDDRFGGYDTYAYLKGPGFYNYASGFGDVEADVTGSGGVDRAYLHGSAGNDMFYGAPGSSRMELGTGRERKAIGFEVVKADALDGAGNDEAYLTGTADDDKFYAFDTYSYLKGPGFYGYAEGFDVVEADGTGVCVWRDWAYLYDTPGDDTFYGETTTSRFVLSTGVENRAVQFNTVKAFSSGGADQDEAYFLGSAIDDDFYHYPTHSKFVTTEYSYRAYGFDYVEADVTTGSDVSRDRAWVYDSVDNDTFRADPNGFQMDFGTTGTDDMKAMKFDIVRAYGGKGGDDDRAYLTGSAGDDRFYGHEKYCYLKGAEFYSAVKYFDYVEADVSGGGGTDRAYLYDGDGDDTFQCNAATLVSQLAYEGGMQYDALGFSVVKVDAGGGADNDSAYLYDTPGDDRFYGKKYRAELVGPGYFIRADGFDNGEAHAQTWPGTDYDRADLYAGTPWNALGDWEAIVLQSGSGGAAALEPDLRFAGWVALEATEATSSSEGETEEEVDALSADYVLQLFDSE